MKNMKKTIMQILITVVIMSIICLVFLQVGWITSSREIGIMFAITVIVIVVDLAASLVWKKICNHK